MLIMLSNRYKFDVEPSCKYEEVDQFGIADVDYFSLYQERADRV